MHFGMLGGWEWVIILVIFILLFGLGKVPNAMKDLGKSIREFRKSVGGEDE